MSRRGLSRAWVSLCLALACSSFARAQDKVVPSGDRVLETRDASGRVRERNLIRADGSRQRTSTQYWALGNLPRRTVGESFDQTGRATARTVEEFDSRGRVLARRSVSIGAGGKESGTQARYGYDSSGHRSETITELGR